ncbi:MAG TPA: methylmalonyl Co-A mutase-associated GTPase MeaB [Rectinemataceae bacterium]
MLDTLGERCRSGDTRAVARLISLLEDGEREAYALLGRLEGMRGRAHVIGITGPPGSGKSTLADKLIGVFRSRGSRVGVLAIDPSSPFSGGAILGDRLRMQGHATDPGVFIRSLASRGRLGGLSRATSFAARVLEEAGYDIVIVETVGVGQSEIDIVKLADTVVLVSVPGLGDEIQIIKAGIMEIGDIFVVNKADRDGADRVVREIRAMLETQAALARGRSLQPVPDTLATHSLDAHHGLAAGAGALGSEVSGNLAQAPSAVLSQEASLPPVIKTVAETGEGVGELARLLAERHEKARADGSLKARRLSSLARQIEDGVLGMASSRLSEPEGRIRIAALAEAVESGEKDIYGAARELFLGLAERENA